MLIFIEVIVIIRWQFIAMYYFLDALGQIILSTWFVLFNRYLRYFKDETFILYFPICKTSFSIFGKFYQFLAHIILNKHCISVLYKLRNSNCYMKKHCFHNIFFSNFYMFLSVQVLNFKMSIIYTEPFLGRRLLKNLGPRHSVLRFLLRFGANIPIFCKIKNVF